MQDNSNIRWSALSSVVLAMTGAGFLLMLAYFIYKYGLTGERQFTNRAVLVTYYLLPIILACGFLAGLRLNRHYRINLAIAFISLSGSLLAGELFLSFAETGRVLRPLWGNDIASHQDEVRELAIQNGSKFDTRTKIEYITDLNAQGIDAVPSSVPLGLLQEGSDGTRKSAINSEGVELLPLGGVSNRVTVFCNETGEYLVYRSDEHGFHNPKGIWATGTAPIVALGDSFTQGGCVPSEKGFVSLIRRQYPGTVNLGMAGDGPLAMLAALREYVAKLKPKVVLWFHFEEGALSVLKTEHRAPLLMKYLNSSFNQGLLERQNVIDRGLLEYIAKERIQAQNRSRTARSQKESSLLSSRVILQTLKLSTLRRKLGIVGAPTVNDSANSATEELELFRWTLAEAKATVDGWSGSLYFVYLPSWERYGNPKTLSQTGGQFRPQVMAITSVLGLPVIDLSRSFAARSDPLELFPFRRFGHYNEEGHGLVAQEVIAGIASVR